MKNTIKKLDPREVVLGIGRNATEAELVEYLDRERKEIFKPLDQVREEINVYLDRKSVKKKAS